MTTRSALRVAHFSDLHYGPRNLAEADRCFGAAIERAVDAGVDVAVISGPSGFLCVRRLVESAVG